MFQLALSSCVRTVGRWCLTLAVAAHLGACVADDGKRPPIGKPPVDARPGTMFLAAQAFRDTNGNGCLDSGLLTVYIFPPNYPRSVQIPGTFDLKLVGRGGTVIREWRLEAPGPDVAPVNAGVGPGYVIRLSLLDKDGSDQLTWQSVDILSRFTDRQGQSVEAAPTSVQVGRSNP